MLHKVGIYSAHLLMTHCPLLFRIYIFYLSVSTKVVIIEDMGYVVKGFCISSAEGDSILHRGQGGLWVLKVFSFSLDISLQDLLFENCYFLDIFILLSYGVRRNVKTLLDSSYYGENTKGIKIRKILCEYLAVLQGHVFAPILESRTCHDEVWSQIPGMFFTFKEIFFPVLMKTHLHGFSYISLYVYKIVTLSWDFCKQFVEHNGSLFIRNQVRNQISQKFYVWLWSIFKKISFPLAFHDSDSSSLWLILLFPDTLSLFCDISSHFNKALSLPGQKSKVKCLYVKFRISTLRNWVQVHLHSQRV